MEDEEEDDEDDGDDDDDDMVGIGREGGVEGKVLEEVVVIVMSAVVAIGYTT